eukprot:scaffold61052_cov52-Attheya_sp.AAC.1
MWIGRDEEDAMKKGKRFEETPIPISQTHSSSPWEDNDVLWSSSNHTHNHNNMDEEDLFVGSLRLPPPRRFGAPKGRSHEAFPTGGVSSPILDNHNIYNSNPNHNQERRRNINVIHPNDPLTMSTTQHPNISAMNMNRSEESSSAATSPVHAIFHSVFGFMSEQETSPSKQHSSNHSHGSPTVEGLHSQPHHFFPPEQEEEEEESHESERQRRLEEERQRIRRRRT